MARKGFLFFLGVLFLSMSLFAFASSGGPYLGIASGYNQVRFPSSTQRTDTIIADIEDKDLPIVLPNTNVVRASSSHYFVNLYGGYLFPFYRAIHVGFELGYINYGYIRMQNLTKDFFGFALGGNIKVRFNSVNLFFVSSIDWKRLFLRSKLGMAYMLGSASSNYSINGASFPGVLFLKGVRNTDQLLFAIGTDLGVYLSQRVALSFTYLGIFSRSYHNSDLLGVADYSTYSVFRAPSMNLFGLALTVNI